MAKQTGEPKRIMKVRKKLGRHKKHMNKRSRVKAYRGQGK